MAMARAVLAALLLSQLRAVLGSTCGAAFVDDAACATGLGIGSTRKTGAGAMSVAYTDDGTFNSADACCVDTTCSLRMAEFLTCKDGALLVADDDPHDVNDNVDDTWNDICKTCAKEVRGSPLRALIAHSRSGRPPEHSPTRRRPFPRPHLQALEIDAACDTTAANSVYETAVVNSLVVDYEANGANKFISPAWDYEQDGYCPDW